MDEIQYWLKATCENVEAFIVTSRFGMLRHLLGYNVLMWGLYFYFNYVHQKDYSKFDMSRIENRLHQLKYRRLCIAEEYNTLFENGFEFAKDSCIQVKIQKGDQKIKVEND
jgi:hypothetical protein